MKHITLSTLAIALLALLSCMPKPNVPKDMFVIKGSLVNVPDSSMIELMDFDGSIYQILNTCIVIDGKFEFCDSIPSDDKILALRSPNEFSYQSLNLWVESQTYIEIKGDGGLVVDWDIRSTHPYQKEETNFTLSALPEALEYAKIDIEENRYRQKAGNSSHSKHKDAIDSLRNIADSISTKMKIKQLDYLRTAPITEHWLYRYSRFAKQIQYYKSKNKIELAAKVEELYTIIPQNLLSSEIGEIITSYVYPPKEICEGDEMADCELFDIDGNVHTLSQLKGKYILLDFWSAGCSPCIAAIPELEEIAEKYENIAIVSVSIDRESIWKEAVKRHDPKGCYQWNELNVKNTLYNSYGNSKGIPYYVVISPEGVVLSKWAGYGKGYLKMKLRYVPLE